MALSEDEIRRRLAEFAARWGGYQGSEVAEAQTFLNQLLEGYGVDRKEAGARFEDTSAGGFMDMFWPGVCIVEMKRPSEVDKLASHRKQALDYWQRSGTPSSPAPRYVVLCAFHRFEVWEPGAVYTAPRAVVDLVDLPDRLDVLNFLTGRHPVFDGASTDVTREAVAMVTEVYQRLQARNAADLDVLRDFVLQSVWAMFAEDLHMLPSHVFTRVLQGLTEDPSRSSADDLGRLFEILGEKGPRPEHGLYEATPFANGSLFTRPARVHLDAEETELLLRAARDFNWRTVEPAIFGGLLQGALGKQRQWALGAHYTHEADILKIVLPTVVEPWRERIAACRTLADVEAAQNDLMHYVVLDPACGSGNFLYVAYRELRRIEAELRRRATDMRRSQGLRDQQTLAVYFPLTNMRGIELDPFAVQLARVTLWMGHKLAVDELGLDETVLPLADLSGIRRGDALRVDWPRADAIIGNPPYHGSQRLRGELGDDYVEWLKAEFGVGIKDYAVYWFRKAHERLETSGRAGLVATNSISQNRSREASLDWIVESGGVITNAVSSQVWAGEAKVHVSIVNWTKEPRMAMQPLLDGVAVEGITSALRAGKARMQPGQLVKNRGVAFQGPIPAGAGFLLTEDEAKELLGRSESDYSQVVKRYLMGEEIADDPRQAPSRWIIDFGLRRLEEARAWPAALRLVDERVRPIRAKNRREAYREKWWIFAEARPGMRKALEGLSRCPAANRVGKRLHFIWLDTSWCPGDKIVVFTRDDDFSMGVLASSLHSAWAWELSSTLKADLNYTPTSAVGTFPFPQPSDKEPVAEAARRVIARRSEICLERQIGLTRLYNEVDDGAYRDLRERHVALDEAVAVAYGWPASAAHDPRESNRLLLELNREITAGRVYWFRKAADSLGSGGRAGLVGTNSISQNFGRGASLDYLTANGGEITNAISSQDWSGEAAVDVSIVNWVKSPSAPPTAYLLDGQVVPGITTALRSTAFADVTEASRIARNRGISFEGVKPGGRGFVLTAEEAEGLLARDEAPYGDVVRPYLIGEDIADDPEQRPRRWIIDFVTMTLEEAQQYPAALEIVRARVKPVRDTNRRKVRRERWWLFSEPVPAMRTALEGLDRYLASNVQGKRLVFCWCEPRVCASNLTKVFALAGDFELGILASSLHEVWARSQSSTLEDRFRYTPTSAFETFPFPQPSDKEPVAEAARRVIARRSEICLERQIGLTRLYNEVDDGAYRDLRELHVALDEAVAAAYGWPASAAHDPQESNRLLLELNREITAGRLPYDPFS